MSATDMVRAIGMLRAVDADMHAAEAFVIAGEPVSKQRPRFTRTGHAYTPASLREATDWFRGELAALASGPMVGNVAVACTFFRATRQRIDVDNLTKFVLDAANGVCWHDDVQVTAIVAVLEHDPERPRTVMALARHQSTMRRGEDAWVPCAYCGEAFDAKAQPIKFCSPECRTAARGVDLSVLVPCVQCGSPFRRRTTSMKLCSEDCRRDWLRGRHRATRKDPRCESCGAPVSKVGYVRCRSCWLELAA